jgi:hypothetical protein
VTYVNAALGLGVLILLGVLMVGLNRLAREERRPERRPLRSAPLAARPARHEQLLIDEPLPEERAGDERLDGTDPREDGVSDGATARRRRSGDSSSDALEELLDL